MGTTTRLVESTEVCVFDLRACVWIREGTIIIVSYALGEIAIFFSVYFVCYR